MAVAGRAGNSACHETRLSPTIPRISNIKIADGGLVTMTDQAPSEILGNNPIGKGLDAFRTSFNSICEDRSISCTPDAVGQLGQEGKTIWRLFGYLLSN